MSRHARSAWAALIAAALFSGTAAAAPPQPVMVKNTSAEAVPVRLVAADEAFQQSFPLDFADGAGITSYSYTVPADKRLVIEYASLTAYLPPVGQSIWLWIATTTGNGYGTSQASHTLDIQKKQDYGLLTVYGAGHLVRLYANPGTEVRATMGRYPGNGLGGGTLILTGRLESLP